MMAPTTHQNAPGYRPHRTLPFRVEFVRQLRRWRTIVAFAVLVALPWILVAAFKISGPGSAGNGTPGLVTVATQGGLNFAAFSLFVSAGFLLVVVVALFCGDTVASEASWSSLRYLLAAPVPRARLLRQKLAVALAYATIAGVSPVVGLYAAPAALIFYAAFGSSRHLVVGPMSATAALSASTSAIASPT